MLRPGELALNFVRLILNAMYGHGITEVQLNGPFIVELLLIMDTLERIQM